MLLAPQHRTYLAFFLIAISTGAFLARIPDLQKLLNVNKTELGLTLIGMAAGALVSLTFSSPVVIRLGARLTLMITLLGTAFLLSLVPFMPNPQTVFFLLFLVGLLVGAFEINLNVEIGRIETQVGFGIMNRAHGFWSVGFFVTAVSASIVRQARIDMQTHLRLVLALVFLLGVLNVAGMKNAPMVAGAEMENAPQFALPTLGLLPLCLIGTAAFLVEGAGIDWSAILHARCLQFRALCRWYGSDPLRFFYGCCPSLRRALILQIDYFVRKLRVSVQRPETLVSISWGYCHLLTATLRGAFPANHRIDGLIAVLEKCLSDIIADTNEGDEPNLHKMMTVLDAIEYHLDKFKMESDQIAGYLSHRTLPTFGHGCASPSSIITRPRRDRTRCQQSNHKDDGGIRNKLSMRQFASAENQLVRRHECRSQPLPEFCYPKISKSSTACFPTL